MKKSIKKLSTRMYGSFILVALLVSTGPLIAQDTAVVVETPAKAEVRLAKNTFDGNWIMDNQTVMVPKKKSMEMTIQHRFGTVNNGAKDMFGLFAPSNIRLGLAFVPINKLMVGVGLTKERMQVDMNAKYAILKQTESEKVPVSVTYFGNMVIDTRDKSNFRFGVHRFAYFNQLMIARKVTDRISVQVAPSFSWYNNVEGYVNSKGDIVRLMKNGHVAVAFMGRYKFSDKSAIVINYDQPLTQHPSNNPHPNISFGFETNTDSHAFQVFFGNYYGIVPESNNVFNKNDYRDGQFVIGFNITRLWAF